MADDILKALSDSYHNVREDASSDGNTIYKNSNYVNLDNYKTEIENINKIKQEEKERYKQLYDNELKFGKYSQKVRADLLQQESNHYRELTNLSKGLHKKRVDILEAERDIYANIAEKGKASRLDGIKLAALQAKERDLERKSVEYRIKKSIEGVNKVKSALNIAIDHTFKRLNELDNIKLWNNWSKGITDLQNQYESNFTNISGRLGTNSRQEGHDFIGSVLGKVEADSNLMKGLNFNNEVFPQITEAVKKGFQGEKAADVAISNSIDKKIMPWLDTSSETWSDLQFNLSDNLLAQLKGQQLQLQATQEGNRILQEGVVSEITNTLSPTLLNIDANTIDPSTMTDQAQRMVKVLRDQGYSKQNAVKAVNQVIDAYQNPLNALQGNNTASKLYALGSLQTGDLAGGVNFANNLLQAGVNGNWATSGIFANLGFVTNGLTRNTDWMSDMLAVSDSFDNYSNADYTGVYNSKVNNINDYVTATQQNDNYQQNKAAMDVFNDAFGNHLLDKDRMILEELQNIKTWLITGFIGNLVSNLASRGFDKLFGKLFGKAGEAGSGIIKSIGSEVLTRGFSLSDLSPLADKSAGWKLGEGLEYGGLAEGLTQGGANLTGLSGKAALASGTAGLLVGGYLVGKGVSTGLDTIKNWDDNSTKDNAVGAAASIGMIGGGAALGAAALGLASGPVGWVGLAVGATALIGKSVYDYNKKMKEACSDVDILGSSFTTLKNQVKQNTDAKLEELDSIRNNFYALGDETKQRKLLVDRGIIPNTDKTKLSTEMLEKYIEKMDIITSDSGEKQEGVLGGLEAKYTASSKNEIKSMVDQIYGHLVGKSEDEQRQLLSELGFSDEEIDAGMKNAKNGAMSKGELWKFLAVNDTKMKGVEIGSLQEKLESGEINENTLNRYASKHNVTGDRITSKEKWMAGLGDLVEAVDYLDRYKQFGRPDDKEEATGIDAVGFNQNTYDQYKAYILGLGKGNKEKVKDVFNEYGINSKEVLSDYPNSLKGYKLGSSYIPNDMLAILHAGERVLTANQNKEYTEELQTGNGSIIVNSIQDVVSAIQNQTKTIIDYLSTMNFNNSPSFKKMNMLPSMGNTRVTL